MSLEDFKKLISRVESQPAYQRPRAFALGIARFSITADQPGAIGPAARILDTYFPVVNCDENFGTAAVLADITGYTHGCKTFYLSEEQLGRALLAFAPFAGDGKRHLNIETLATLHEALIARSSARPQGVVIPQHICVTFIGDFADKPVDAHDVYLRLHLLSHRRVKPHGVNLDGIFGLLNNVVWTNQGPFDTDQFETVRLQFRTLGVPLTVLGVDKFPRMTDYVIPSGVRIADADRVRLGAHLADGTTVMHEGFCNFNAGTLGKSMVEGRISAGVVVGNGSDIGGGASIMGTLSGGGKEVISIGEQCLLGANCGLGISLGNHCTVEAGLYLTASSKVTLVPDGTVIKAAQLSGKNDLLFRRNSVTGSIEALNKKGGGWAGLNAALHAN